MASAIKTAILLITPERLIRADLTASSVELFSQEAPPTEDISLLVDTCLRLNASIPKQVLVLTTEVWTQVLSLPVATSRTSTVAEINQLLKFEVEAETGTSALDLELASRLIDQNNVQSQYQITALSALQFQQIVAVVRDFGCKFLGLAHPAGLPVSFNPEASESWNRLEIWSQVTVLVNSENQLKILDGIYQTTALPDDFLDSQVTENLQLFQNSVGQLLPGYAVCLDDEQALKNYFEHWKPLLTDKTFPVSRLQPAKEPISGSLKAIIAVVLAIVAAFGANVVHLQMQQQAKQLEKQIAAAKLPQENLAQVNRLNQKQQRELKKIEEEHKKKSAEIETAKALRQSLQLRFIALLSALREDCPAGVVIDSIETNAKSIIIRGRTLQTRNVQDFANDLSNELKKLDLYVGPANETILATNADKTLWRFEIVVSDEQDSAKKAANAQFTDSRGRF